MCIIPALLYSVHEAEAGHEGMETKCGSTLMQLFDYIVMFRDTASLTSSGRPHIIQYGTGRMKTGRGPVGCPDCFRMREWISEHEHRPQS